MKLIKYQDYIGHTISEDESNGVLSYFHNLYSLIHDEQITCWFEGNCINYLNCYRQNATIKGSAPFYECYGELDEDGCDGGIVHSIFDWFHFFNNLYIDIDENRLEKKSPYNFVDNYIEEGRLHYCKYLAEVEQNTREYFEKEKEN